MRGTLLAVVIVFSGACSEADPKEVHAAKPEKTREGVAAAPIVECRIVEASLPLPDEVRESSGLAQSRRDPGLFWTHNDAGNSPDLFAIRSDGQLVQRVRVTGAELADWEALDSGACGSGSCLFVGDIGDNDERREHVTIYRIPEPEVGASASVGAEALHARYPDGAQDAEGLFVLPNGDLFIVTKGRSGPITLYRYPAPQRAGEPVVLERVREILPRPKANDDRVTGATSSPDGRWVGVRSYRTLYLYPAQALVRGDPVEPSRVDLTPVGHTQGESIAISGDGSVWMTTEAEKKGDRPRWSRLQCTLPGS